MSDMERAIRTVTFNLESGLLGNSSTEDNSTEDNSTENGNVSQVLDKAGQFLEDKTKAEKANQSQQINAFFVIEQINKIMAQTDYIHEAIASLSRMSDGECGPAYSAGNIQGQAKANAFKDIVCYRETTNQQVLRMYEKMYDDLYGRRPLEQSIVEFCKEVIKDPKLSDDAKIDLVSAIGDTIHTAKLEPESEMVLTED